MKNILFLTDYYCENASANGICCKYVAQELVRRGYRVFVGTYRPVTSPELETMDGVQVFRTWTMPQEIQHKTRKERFGIYGKWLLPFSQTPVTEVRERTEDICLSSRSMIEKAHIDTVICIHLPVETLIAGTRLKKEFPSVRFCGYMLDSLSGGDLPRFLPETYARKRKIRWEDGLLRQMDRTFLMESSRSHHAKYTSERSWMDRAVYGDIPRFLPPDEADVVNDSNQVVRVVYAGTLADGVRTPNHFLQVLDCVTSLQIELIIAGHNHCKERFQIRTDNQNVVLTQLRPVPYAEALELLRSAHILVNFGNHNNALVPSKIFEYMSLGKPIVSTSCHADDPARQYLKKYHWALLLDEQKCDYDAQARQLEEFIRHARGAHISGKALADAFYSNTPGAFADTLVQSFEDR